MLGALQKFSQICLDTLFPPYCLHCKALNSWFCENCLSQVDYITTHICSRCGTPWANGSCKHCLQHQLHDINGIRAAACFYDDPMRSTIHAFKYNNQKAVAGVLGQILAKTYQQYNLKAEVLVAVPLHPSRLKERGYNQSELLAQQLGRLLQLPVSSLTLQRTKKTKSQITLGATERKENVAGAFACCDNRLTNKHILLIDDVCTTGSTLDACAAALKASGSASVWGLTLARAC